MLLFYYSSVLRIHGKWLVTNFISSPRGSDELLWPLRRKIKLIFMSMYQRYEIFEISVKEVGIWPPCQALGEGRQVARSGSLGRTCFGLLNVLQSRRESVAERRGRVLFSEEGSAAAKSEETLCCCGIRTEPSKPRLRGPSRHSI